MAQKHTGNLSPEFALLGFLIAGPSHGYDLHQRFTVELGHVWHLSQSQAYAILKRLVGHGDITSQVVEQEKLPSRQKLRITAQGRQRYFEWLKTGIATNSRSIRLEFLTRLYFTQFHRPKTFYRSATHKPPRSNPPSSASKACSNICLPNRSITVSASTFAFNKCASSKAG
jgi:DNA-binding PadR family transcriptional regulator